MDELPTDVTWCRTIAFIVTVDKTRDQSEAKSRVSSQK